MTTLSFAALGIAAFQGEAAARVREILLVYSVAL
jgi:hypothetical protein